MTFSSISIQQIQSNLGFESLNSIQQASIKASLTHNNLMLIAPTGSGKTAAYLLSMIQQLKDKEGVQALVLAPTRELVIQIESVLKLMKLPFKTNSAYGGHKFSIERENFKTPPIILVGTPGRVQDHINRKTIDLSNVQHLIFDEFDKSLEFGFTEQMEAIRAEMNRVKQQILVSATQSIEIPEYLHFTEAHTLNFAGEKEEKLSLQQIIVPKDEKPEGLVSILYGLKEEQNAIVFVNHREVCERLAQQLDFVEASYSIFHGGLEQDQRELELTKFRNGSSRVLIATDIAARGIDIPDLDYVIHYQLPPQETAFIHRNGRTARMKATGTSVLVLTELDYLPEYITETPEKLPYITEGEIPQTEWQTIYVSKGKKDKVNKIDFVGFFCQFDFIEKSDIGLIEVKDYAAWIAIKRNKVKPLMRVVRNYKIKNKKARIAIAR
jgi:superfamily II DNA/RNA helicase